MLKQIKIRIFPNGQVQAETTGIKGRSCTEYIQLIENLLDARAVESAYTEEYHEVQVQELPENTVRHNNE